MTIDNTATIHNVKLEHSFTILPNAAARDPNLSWDAKGLLWYILSLPSDWTIHTWQLAKVYTGSRKGSGLDAVKSILKELREAGYINYVKYRDSKGKYKHRYDVYPIPVTDFQKMFPERVKPPVDEPAVENPPIIRSTELPSTISKKKDIIANPPDKPKEVPKPAGGNNKFPECLNICEDLTPYQKKTLSKYDPVTLEKAIKYAYHPDTKLEGPNARIKQIHAFCKTPEAYEDAFNTLGKPKKKQTFKEMVLSSFQRGTKYKKYEFYFDEVGCGFYNPENLSSYGIKWQEPNTKEKFHEILKKIGLLK